MSSAPAGARHVTGFAIGCALFSIYGFLSGAWPFGVVEAIWATIAIRRYQRFVSAAANPPGA